MLSRLPPGVLQQLTSPISGGMGGSGSGGGRDSSSNSLLPLHNQLRLEAALGGLDSSSMMASSSFMRPNQSLSMESFMAARPSMSSMYGAAGSTNFAARMGAGASDFGGLFSGTTNTSPMERSRDLMVGGAGGSARKSSQRASPKSTKPRKKRVNKKLNVPYSPYDPGDTKDLSLPSDKSNLSAYQCLLREQILLFAVQISDIQCSAQGRNKPITLGQVGVLCRHCARIPPGLRPCGAVYFPGKLSGLYQASQNMAINHFAKSCQSIPEETRQKLLKLKEQKSSVLGGGKHFWANGARVLGVYETEDGTLRFKKEESSAKEKEKSEDESDAGKKEEEGQEQEKPTEQDTPKDEEAGTKDDDDDDDDDNSKEGDAKA